MTDPDFWPCPRLAPHPPTPTARQLTKLNWTAERPYRVRVLDYTCSCRTIVYELLASGGTYVIRRTHQTVPRKETYAGPWARCEAEHMWTLILTGEASLWSMSTEIIFVRAGPTLQMATNRDGFGEFRIGSPLSLRKRGEVLQLSLYWTTPYALKFPGIQPESVSAAAHKPSSESAADPGEPA